MTKRCCLLLVCLLLLSCGGSSATPNDMGVASSGDADDDTISDEDEGAPSRDSDDDGIPDFEDPDSDNDSIPDRAEAGDVDLDSPPADSDGDGTPDYRDLDADDNGIPDATEGVDDIDNDGEGNFRDEDDDGDTLSDALEIDGRPLSPPDTDGDGQPDFRDVDSDGDFLLDRDERADDPDGDGVPSYLDDDADGDGILDVDEAGDRDLNTPPVDTDGDFLFDFLDPDSDDDGIADDIERLLETDPQASDSDGDGVSDLIEFVAQSDPTDAEDSPRSRGDFVFTVPFREAPAPRRDTLRFRSGIQAADLYFSFDTSTSMTQETGALANATTGVPGIIDRLSCEESDRECVENEDCNAGEVCGPRQRCAEDPAENRCLLDLHTGVGRWDHIDSFINLVGLQDDPGVTAAGIPSATEFWVAPLQAVACVADGANCSNFDANCEVDGVGCPGFRRSAVRVLVHITDANDECLCGTGTVFPCDPLQGPSGRCAMFNEDFAGDELRRQQIRFIGLIGNGTAFGQGDATVQARDIGRRSGSIDGDGEPFVYSATDAAVVDQTVAAVRELVSDGRFEYTIEARDAPDDDGDARQFIDRLEVNVIDEECETGAQVADLNSDGVAEVFQNVQPGADLCWDVVVRRNEAVPPTRAPQVFRAVITVFGDNSPVDSRRVYFLVPADVTLPPIE